MDITKKIEDEKSNISTGMEKINRLLENASDAKIAERNKALVANAVCSDIAFHIEGDDDYIPAHKVFIGMGSKKLSKLSFGAENTEPIQIEKIHREDFMEVLKYVYTDVAMINEANALAIMKCANKLELTPLETQCCTFLITNIDDNNAIEYFKQSFLLQNGLTAHSSTFIRNNINVALKSASFFMLSIEEMREILCKDFVLKMHNKTDLFFAFLDWAESRCIAEDLPLSAEQKRNIIGERLETVLFTEMSAHEFMACINREPKFFNSSEIGEIILQIAASQKTAQETFNFVQNKTPTFGGFVWGSSSRHVSTNSFSFASPFLGNSSNKETNNK